VGPPRGRQQHLNDPRYLDPIRQMDITLAVGEQDPFHQSNCMLSQAFTDKDVPHRLAIWPGRGPPCPILARDGALLPVTSLERPSAHFIAGLECIRQAGGGWGLPPLSEQSLRSRGHKKISRIRSAALRCCETDGSARTRQRSPLHRSITNTAKEPGTTGPLRPPADAGPNFAAHRNSPHRPLLSPLEIAKRAYSTDR
jgi:hypothetical protein